MMVLWWLFVMELEETFVLRRVVLENRMFGTGFGVMEGFIYMG